MAVGLARGMPRQMLARAKPWIGGLTAPFDRRLRFALEHIDHMATWRAALLGAALGGAVASLPWLWLGWLCVAAAVALVWSAEPLGVEQPDRGPLPGPAETTAESLRTAADAVPADPEGPLFISYAAYGDGPTLAREIALTLRTWGVPVWHDETQRLVVDAQPLLEEALVTPLAGGVLVVTPELAQAMATRTIDVSRLLQRSAHDPRFALLIGTTLTDGAGQPDLVAVDRLLGHDVGMSRTSLRHLPHFPINTPEGRARLARVAAHHRMRFFAETGADELPIDVRTRDSGRRERGTGLLVRTRPPVAGDTPPAEMWPTYTAFLAEVPALARQSGARRVRVSGAAHLSAAFALGAALPQTAPFAVTVVNGSGVASEGEADIAPIEESRDLGAARQPVAIFVDLLEREPTRTFETHLRQRPGEFSAALKLAVPERRRSTPAEEATLVRRSAARILAFVKATAAPTPVHLFLAVPFASAVLLGRLLGRVSVQLYELRHLPEPHYVASVLCQRPSVTHRVFRFAAVAAFFRRLGGTA